MSWCDSDRAEASDDAKPARVAAGLWTSTALYSAPFGARAAAPPRVSAQCLSGDSLLGVVTCRLIARANRSHTSPAQPFERVRSGMKARGHQSDERRVRHGVRASSRGEPFDACYICSAH